MYVVRRSHPQQCPLQWGEEDEVYEEDVPIVFDPVVYDKGPVETGLVDQYGDPIWRDERGPLGFLTFT